MSGLQDYMNRRHARPSSRPNSPHKVGPPASRIPQSRSDIAKAHIASGVTVNDDENKNGQDIDDSEYTRDSELESLANLDHRGFDNDEEDSDGESSFNGADILGPDGELPRAANWLQTNGNNHFHQGSGGSGNGGYVAHDERSDGTTTPRPLSDEENLQRDAAAQFSRGVAAAAALGSPNSKRTGSDDDDLPQQFYTSLELDQRREESNRSNPRSGTVSNNAGGSIRQQKMADRTGTGDRSWQDLDDEFRKSGGRIDGESIPFDVDGMLEMLGQRLKLALRGSARLSITDFWFPYKILTIQSPSLPYFIWIPPAPHTTLEVARMTSEVATMAFVRRYHPSIPVPEVVYYDADVNNLAGVPFFVTKAIHGQFVGYTNGKDLVNDRKTMMTLLDQLAKIHAELLKPPRGFTPTHIGNIMFRNDAGGGGTGGNAGGSSGGNSATAAAAAAKNAFTTGPLLVTMDDDSDLDDPSLLSAGAAAAAAVNSLPDLCMHLFQVSESRTLMDPPRDPKSLRELRSVKRRLAGLLGILPQLPARLSNLSLFHASLNLSSLVIDPRTRNITCVPIWRDACILPFALAVSYPREIRPKNAEWKIWVDDATETAASSTSSSSAAGRIDENFGYRSVYDARLAKYDIRFASDVWEDEELGRWVKVYELVGGGWKLWIQRIGWIEAELEVARRM